MRKINLIAIALLFFPIISAQQYNCPMGSGYFGMMSGSYGFSYGIFSWLMGVLVIVGLVLLIVWLFKQIQKK